MSPAAAPHVNEFRVRYAETDQMGVVYHANYLIWCEIGRTDMLRAKGANYADLERSGILLAVAEANVRYHASARYDDLIRVETRLTELRSRAMTFEYSISHAERGTRFVSATTRLVSLDRSARPTALPADVRALLEPDDAG